MVGKRQEQIKTKQKFTLEKAASTSVNINSGGHVDGTYHWYDVMKMALPLWSSSPKPTTLV